jgi:indolepyruvate ferredoxin oxidoreductase
MLQSDVAVPAVASLEEAIVHRSGDGVAFIDAKRIAECVFADHLLANVVLLGAAFQLGGLPVSVADVERVMTGLGAAAARNMAAFDWGRWAVHDLPAVEASLGAADRGAASIFDPSASAQTAAAGLVARRSLPAEVRDLVTRRAAQVADYQDPRRAERFLDLVERVSARDDAGHGWALTRAVAEAWFKLLTYKDEYEGARLHLKMDYDRAARDLGITGRYSVRYHLHPPVLRRLGLAKKLPLGWPYELAFRTLARMKRLRGTPLDVFGWDRDRQTELALIAEYERLIGEFSSASSALPYEAQVRIAASAMSIKGYAAIKNAAVADWREQVAALRASGPVA